MASESPQAAILRRRMVDHLVEEGTIVSPEVEAAFRTVPRSVFAPDVPVEAAYAQDIVVAKRDEQGVTVSSVSAPAIQAMMLEQAGLRPGMRVLEIGSGGYNAALMAELVGDSGHVTTVDIDPDIVKRARACLDQAGYPYVEVRHTDGETGCPDLAPYDRIMVTAGAWDIPPSWEAQLAAGGSITVPLRIRGLTRSLNLVRDRGRLVAGSALICGFVSMQGSGAHDERLLLLRGEEIGLRLDDDSGPADPHQLDGALATTRVETWTGVTVERTEPFDTLQLWLATALDGFCLLSVDPARDTGLVAPQNRIACPAVVDGASLAYLALRRVGESTFEFGTHAYGTDAAALGDFMAASIQRWAREHRGGPGPRIEVYPADHPDFLWSDRTITKRHVRITISWPRAPTVPADQGAVDPPTEQE